MIGASGADGRTLRFLANVDPVDVARALTGLEAESTLVIVVSKVFIITIIYVGPFIMGIHGTIVNPFYVFTWALIFVQM